MHSFDKLLSGSTAWKVLGWFLREPTGSIHVNRLARELAISPSSASTLLLGLHRSGILRREQRANALFYRLENGSLVVRQMKRLHTVMTLEDVSAADRFLRLDDAIITLALYGSYASGENDARSDIDLLVITGSKDADHDEAVKAVGKAFAGEANLLKHSPSSWDRVKKNDANFHDTVMANHIILYGSELP